MNRYATIDIGTNSVLLLVAEKHSDGSFTAVVEQAEITRLGRGVDKTQKLSPEALEDTLRVLEAFVAEARSHGVKGIAVSATSAARDASNGAEFLEAAKQKTGVEVEIISGDLEAQLSFAAVRADFEKRLEGPLVVIDIGGGSTEFIYGGAGDQRGEIQFRRSFDLGSVRLTERFVTRHPVPAEERAKISGELKSAFSALPPPPAGFHLIGVAGTVTTLLAIHEGIVTYDASKIHGGTLTRRHVRGLVTQLCDLSLEDRIKLPGLQPKRADVICAGALILQAAMNQLEAHDCRVSDRGLRWGLLAQRFGGTG